MPTRVSKVPSRRREKLGHRLARARVGELMPVERECTGGLASTTKAQRHNQQQERQEREESRRRWRQINGTDPLPQPGEPELVLVPAFAEKPLTSWPSAVDQQGRAVDASFPAPLLIIDIRV